MATHFARGILSTGSRYRHVCQRPVINPHVFSRHIARLAFARRARCLPSCCLCFTASASCLKSSTKRMADRFLAIANCPLFDRLYWQYRWCCPHHRGDCGLDMELQRTVRSRDADRHNFSNNENLWINIQHDPDEARSQLVALRRSVLKLTGEASRSCSCCPALAACAPPAVSHRSGM
ncbi:phosphopantetheinyl transferase [Klebsiella pneumoniae]|uniref:Phosphopantetheinyl transferase n=1 Tax=Klebsiella pneumoniae TaxID=573 RepID=A0A2X3CLR9_KLEPN|nr:phosphopantetheinyl transferase [Klebsiella pneumoniae]